MILTELKAYLMKNQQVALPELAHHFNLTPEATRDRLTHWIRKGKVRRLEERCQAGCCCNQPPVEMYEWVG